MGKIDWMSRGTDKEIFLKNSEGKLLWKYKVRRRNERTGHITRHEGMLKLIMEGKNYRGRTIRE